MSGDRKLIGWKAYYFINNQITSFDSKQTTWEGLPTEGLLILERIFEDGTQEIVHGFDLYCLESNYLSTDKNIKKGISIQDEQFWELYDEIRDAHLHN